VIAQQRSRQQSSLEAGGGRGDRAARGRAFVAPMAFAAGLICFGCGAVEFVPSPFTPQNVDLVFSPQEDITVVRWKVSSKAPGSDLKFQLLGENGYRDIVFSQSVYPGGPSACTDGSGTCYQYVVRGQYPVSVWKRPIQAEHAVYGVLPGPIVPQLETAKDPTLSVAALRFLPNNSMVQVQMTDQVALASPYAYPRQYRRAMWPSPGVCVAPAAPDGVAFTALDASGGFPPDLPLTSDGIYCVGIVPVPSDGGNAALAQQRVQTVPVVSDLQQGFMPPVEQSPVIYQIILDLEIPIAERCTSALSTIESTVDTAMKMANTTAMPMKLPTQNIALDKNGTDGSAGCTQQDAPMLDPDPSSLAQQVFQLISATPQTYQQFHFFFFSNLNSSLPATLNTQLNALFMDLGSPPPGYTLDLHSYLFNPGAAAVPTPGAPKPNWTMPVQPWQVADDPALAQLLNDYAQQNLPYESQLHDPNVPVPLLSPTDAMMDDGDWIKICDSTIPVTPVDTNPLVPFPGMAAWPVMGANPPGYLVTFPPNNRIPYGQFVANNVAVDVELCTAYCKGHAFTPKSGGAAVDDWSTSYACAETQ
jgi:hypothetical protein